MQDARSTTTGLVTTAWDFSQQPAATIDAERRNFVCTFCGCPAHFRRASSNGHDACFAGRPHADDCELAVRGDGPWGPEGDEVVRRWQADQTRIVLTLASDADEPGEGGSGASQGQRGGGRHTGNGEPLTTRIQRGPKKLLTLLMTSNVFRTSSVAITKPDGTSMPANQFFVTFENANPASHVGRFHGFWGVATNASTWHRDGSLYINTQAGINHNRIALNVPSDQVATLLTRFRLRGHDLLRGKYILAFGTPYQSTSGQFTLPLLNPSHMAVIDPAVITIVL